MILWCLRFDITVVYKPGIKIPVADALSRVCIPTFDHCISEEHEVNFIDGMKSPLDVGRIKEESFRDITFSMLKDMVFRGWPSNRKQCPQELWDYWNFRCDLVIEDNLVLKGHRMVIPNSIRKEVLDT